MDKIFQTVIACNSLYGLIALVCLCIVLIIGLYYIKTVLLESMKTYNTIHAKICGTSNQTEIDLHNEAAQAASFLFGKYYLLFIFNTMKAKFQDYFCSKLSAYSLILSTLLFFAIIEIFTYESILFKQSFTTLISLSKSKSFSSQISFTL